MGCAMCVFSGRLRFQHLWYQMFPKDMLMFCREMSTEANVAVANLCSLPSSPHPPYWSVTSPFFFFLTCSPLLVACGPFQWNMLHWIGKEKYFCLHFNKYEFTFSHKNAITSHKLVYGGNLDCRGLIQIFPSLSHVAKYSYERELLLGLL